MSARDNLEKIIESPEFAPNIAAYRILPPREGIYAPFPDDLNPAIIEALKRRGIDRLYTHQAEVWQKARQGKNVVVVTPTASGKTLCYNLPCLQAMLSDETARCLYLFPTKALSQDQRSELNELAGKNNGLNIKVSVYDGDTPESLRISARDTGRIIISNPDMLHAGILPNHPKWIKFFSNLKYIVIDEAHAYRGVFGSHVANVIRRLRRASAFYGARPQFILCSATIGNPAELACALIGQPVELVDKNGAPCGEKRIILYNPQKTGSGFEMRKSVDEEGNRWMVALLKAGIKTILFAHSRIRTEVVASYVNSDLSNIFTDNSRIRVEAYRGGFLPNERHEIERGLREGEIHGVVSTNALELGIDIGGLDASIIAGFPGSINSFWQQSGRAGRRAGTAVSVFIANMSPVDQFIMNEPEWFFRKNAEEARIDPDNPYILTDHVKCACFELPFVDEQLTGGGCGEHGESYSMNAKEALEYLEEAGVVRLAGGKWHWADRAFPAEKISLRSASADNVVIIDVTGGRNAVIGEMDRPGAKEMIFANAVYIHRGRQFIVEELDIENRKCLVREADVNYYTDGLVKTDIKVLTEDERRKAGEAVNSDNAIGQPTPGSGFSSPYLFECALSDVLVRSQATKYKKIKFKTEENIGYGEISLPEEEMQTCSAVLLFPPESAGGAALAKLDEKRQGGALSGIGTMMRSIAPLFLLCDPRDLGIAERVRDPHFGVSALYIYDKYPGGIGLAERLAGRTEPLLAVIEEALGRCPCKNGCPSCVGAQGDKAAAMELVKQITGDKTERQYG
uniref:ATP-dependent RNA helicase n=1 Tax=uncultured bacterium contig00019 TaxID=1181510 RepID=A0A806KJ53_9BACT|nr:ATP-dependent RNA helicase [uncultured bacterium contig00019]